MSTAKRSPDGFTLIEIMVALAVFSLAAMALIRLEGAAIRSAGTVDETVMAQIVARNIAVEAVIDARAPALGVSNGVEANGKHQWRWSRNIAATGDQRILRVDVTVSDQSGRQAARLTMVRPPDMPR